MGCEHIIRELAVVKNGLSEPTEEQMVGINGETTSRVTIRAKLSRKAVVKEQRLGWVCLQKRRQSPIRTQIE